MDSGQNTYITSADPSFNYLSYLPLVAKSCTLKSKSDLLLVLNLPTYFSKNLPQFCSKWTKLKVYELLPGIDPRVQAKISRMWAATEEEFYDNFITLCDIDMVQLDDSREKVLEQFRGESLVKWGFDHPSYQVDPDIGKWPMDGTSAKGKIFQQIVNPKKISFNSAVQEWQKNSIFDLRARPFNAFESFSDESLLKVLLDKVTSEIPTVNVSRLIYERKMLSSRLDKAEKQPFFAKSFLVRREIHEFHGPRPFNHRTRIGREILYQLEISLKEYETFVGDLKSILKSEMS